MKKTPLFEKHTALGGKMVEFGGFCMPIQYKSILNEHFATRNEAALFDTCHMGEFSIEGKGAADDLEKILSCDVDTLKIGACRYGLICNDQGGVIDDQILYRVAEQKFFMVVNAATEESDFFWIKENCSDTTEVKNLSSQTAKLDLQGPNSPFVINKLVRTPISSLKYFNFQENFIDDQRVLISRTGYTGEMGFEIYCDNRFATELWDTLLEAGATPAGLGARNTLRLEMGYPLYGHELRRDINAAQSGLDRALSRNKEFIGSKVIGDSQKNTQALCGIISTQRRAAKEGDTIVNTAGEPIGYVTSASFSPTLKCSIALGYIENSSSAIATSVTITSGTSSIEGKITELPFFREGTARKKLSSYFDE
ncbi:glycine cleavage system aminomethyltransferase GcvT [Chitinispirillales bacterium ANBcel5]|uniref:glycine cleavage system aminomethyltransferase GcvT n=1 Tax=Cellulosispirillum alkaliphilum TaxID=3039283 RepID=UPI002A52F4BF|nr:glycine cleavage system aminomethyltransferase GcvT [Chitinispirillales bacterium ANBcel5]